MSISQGALQRLAPEGYALLERAAAVAEGLGYPLYLVGGTVRDLLLGVATADLDLTVEGDGRTMAEALAQAIGGRVTAHSQFGTARVRAGSFVADVATARRECYLHPGALPVVHPASLQEDLFRRDFTINAIAITLMPTRWGELVDPFGGTRDLEARQVRILHDKSFQDDPTRMMRAVRYGRRLGFTLEDQTEVALRRDAPYLRFVSGPRRWKELQRLLEEAQPEQALLWGEGLGFLPYLHPALRADRWLAEAFAAARREAPPASAAISLCLLAYRLAPQERLALIADFQLTASTTKALNDLAQAQARLPQLSVTPTPSQTVQLLHGLAPQALQACAVTAQAPQARQALRNYLTTWRKVKPRLSGEALQRLGVPPGPEMGACLAALRAARLDGEATTEEQETALVRHWVTQRTRSNL